MHITADIPYDRLTLDLAEFIISAQRTEVVVAVKANANDLSRLDRGAADDDWCA